MQMNWIDWVLKIVPLLLLVSLLSGCMLTIGVDRLPDKTEGGAVGVSFQRESARESSPRPYRIRN